MFREIIITASLAMLLVACGGSQENQISPENLAAIEKNKELQLQGKMMTSEEVMHKSIADRNRSETYNKIERTKVSKTVADPKELMRLLERSKQRKMEIKKREQEATIVNN